MQLGDAALLGAFNRNSPGQRGSYASSLSGIDISGFDTSRLAELLKPFLEALEPLLIQLGKAFGIEDLQKGTLVNAFNTIATAGSQQSVAALEASETRVDTAIDGQTFKGGYPSNYNAAIADQLHDHSLAGGVKAGMTDGATIDIDGQTYRRISEFQNGATGSNFSAYGVVGANGEVSNVVFVAHGADDPESGMGSTITDYAQVAAGMEGTNTEFNNFVADTLTGIKAHNDGLGYNSAVGVSSIGYSMGAILTGRFALHGIPGVALNSAGNPFAAGSAEADTVDELLHHVSTQDDAVRGVSGNALKIDDEATLDSARSGNHGHNYDRATIDRKTLATPQV